MAYCRKCGNELDIDDEFCEKCGTNVRKKNNKNEYNIEQVVKNIDLYGESNDFTEIKITIEETGKKVVVKVPNGITDGDQLKLKGLGKLKPDNTKGDVFLIFKDIKYHLNVKDFKKTELKNLKCPSCGATLDLDEELLDSCKCDYCKSTIFFEGLSNEAYRSKTKIKKMKHDEIMADKYHEYNKELTDKKYNYKKNDEIRKFKLGVLTWGLIILGFSLFFYDKEKKSIKQEEGLQLLVEEVMDLVEDKKYDEACLKAKSIIYTEDWSSEIEEKWDKKRKETINYIIKEEKKDKGKSSCKAEKDGLFGLFD